MTTTNQGAARRRRSKVAEQSPAIAAPMVFTAHDVEALAKRIKERLEGQVASANDAARGFAKKIIEADEPAHILMYQLGWAKSPAETAALAFYAARALATFAHFTDGVADPLTARPAYVVMLEALRAEVDSATADLIHDRLNGGSTSAWSNATDDARRAAASSFVRWYGAEVAFLEEAARRAGLEVA